MSSVQYPELDPKEFFRNPEKTALVIIDMQNDFVMPPAPLATPNGTKIIPKVNELAKWARANEHLVIFTQEMHRSGYQDFGIEHFFEPIHCVEGTPGCEIVDGIDIEESDLIVRSKRRYDAFFGTELDVLLRSNDIENVLFTGVCTDICVISSVFEARNLDYRCFVVSDAVDGSSKERNDAALLGMSHVWSHVGTSEEAKELFTL